MCTDKKTNQNYKMFTLFQPLLESVETRRAFSQGKENRKLQHFWCGDGILSQLRCCTAGNFRLISSDTQPAKTNCSQLNATECFSISFKSFIVQYRPANPAFHNIDSLNNSTTLTALGKTRPFCLQTKHRFVFIQFFCTNRQPNKVIDLARMGPSATLCLTSLSPR